MGYMTDGLTFNVLRNANVARAAESQKYEKCKTWCLGQWSNATLGELGEAANIIKKIERGDFELASVRKELANELADVAIYLDLLAEKAGINLGQATMDKWNEKSAQIGSSIRIEADDWHRIAPPLENK